MCNTCRLSVNQSPPLNTVQTNTGVCYNCLKHAHPLVDRWTWLIPGKRGRCYTDREGFLPESGFKTLACVSMCVYVCERERGRARVREYPVKITRRRAQTAFLWPYQCVCPVNTSHQRRRNHLTDTTACRKWGNNREGGTRRGSSAASVWFNCEWEAQLLATKMSGKIESKQGKPLPGHSSADNGSPQTGHGRFKCVRATLERGSTLGTCPVWMEV